MNDSEIRNKHTFWRRILIAGVLVVIISILMLVTLYLSEMSEIRSQVGLDSELEMEIAILEARNELIFWASKWTLPFAFLGSLATNIARYRLRKLRKLKNLENM